VKTSGPCIIVLTAPSGSGKTTVARELLAAFPTMRFSVSATTRPRRSNEVHSVHYHFLTQSQFDQELLDGNLLESEEVYPGCWYGTLRSEVENSSATAPVLLDIDVQGALNVKSQYGEKAFILFVRPPSLVELEKRLRARGTETDVSLAERLARAAEELGYTDRFDTVIVNDILETAVSDAVLKVRSFLESRV
jgi:guanylate kinase